MASTQLKIVKKEPSPSRGENPPTPVSRWGSAPKKEWNVAEDIFSVESVGLRYVAAFLGWLLTPSVLCLFSLGRQKVTLRVFFLVLRRRCLLRFCLSIWRFAVVVPSGSQ